MRCVNQLLAHLAQRPFQSTNKILPGILELGRSDPALAEDAGETRDLPGAEVCCSASNRMACLVKVLGSAGATEVEERSEFSCEKAEHIFAIVIGQAIELSRIKGGINLARCCNRCFKSFDEGTWIDTLLV